MAKKMVENVKDDGELEELEMLLNEIPKTTSNNLVHLHHRNGHVYVDHDGPCEPQEINGMCGMYGDDDDPLTQIQYPCTSSPSNGFSLKSDSSSSSSLFSVGHALSDTGSPTPPPLGDHKSTNTMPSGSSNSLWFDSNSMTPDLTATNKANESLVDELGLCANMSKMYINNQQDDPYDFNYASIGMNGLPFRDCFSSMNSPNNVHKHGDCYDLKREFIDSVGVQSHFPMSPISYDAEMNSMLSGLTRDYKMANLFGSRQCAIRPETMLPQLNGFSGSRDSRWHRRQQMNNCYYRGIQAPETTISLSRNQMVDALLYAQENGMNLMGEIGKLRLTNSSLCTNSRSYDAQNLVQYSHPLSNTRSVPPSNARIQHGNLDSIRSEGSFILQGEGLSYVVGRGSDCSRCQSKDAVHETGFVKHLRRSELDMGHQVVGINENPTSARIGCSSPSLSKFNSLAEAQGYMHLIAKDQHGCRFLQRMFDEGTPEDVQVIFSEIIVHVVELMMNPFGNYLMQKLLDVCNEEQRMQILLIITEEPGQLVRISLNTHGTRVVQKLIETLKTRQQISLAVLALEPGFLSLIKDLNGNHVVQRCLQCLSNEDNKFIFVAAAKYCVEIATHKHGCCVLQRCIGYSSGEHREKLIAEISANALLLAQDQYGNYVVQFILELRIPSATASLSMEFQGNYVHLSRQKFGSHVVEKCLILFNDENRSRIILELISVPHFEHLLQDPHANYVVQKALRHSEGHVHNLLAEAIESHKAMCRNSPYSKKIISQKLSKK